MKAEKEQAASFGRAQWVQLGLLGISLGVVLTCGTGSHLSQPKSAAEASQSSRPEATLGAELSPATAASSSPAPSVAALSEESAEQGPKVEAQPEGLESARQPEGRFLMQFRQDLAALAAGTRKEPVRITWLGDSHTAADFWTDRVRQDLAVKYGVGGPGFIHLGLKNYRHSGVRIEQVGKWSQQPTQPASSNKQADAVFGLGGVRTRMVSSDAKLRLTPYPSALEGRASWRIRYRFSDGQSSFRASLGEKTRTIRASEGAIGASRVLVLEGEKQERLTLSHVSGSPEFLGVILEGSEPGIVLDTLGINGARVATALAWDEASYIQLLRERAPSLLVLAYGTNEAGASTPVERYREHFQALLSRLRRAAPGASCALFGPTDWVSQGKTKARIIQLDQLEEEWAEELGCAYFSVFRAMGGEESVVRWAREVPPLASNDLIHLTPRGYSKIGEQTSAWLLEGLNAQP